MKSCVGWLSIWDVSDNRYQSERRGWLSEEFFRYSSVDVLSCINNFITSRSEAKKLNFFTVSVKWKNNDEADSKFLESNWNKFIIITVQLDWYSISRTVIDLAQVQYYITYVMLHIVVISSKRRYPYTVTPISKISLYKIADFSVTNM